MPIPILSIEPLIENAVKHGIAPKVEGGVVRPSEAVGGALRVIVSDTGSGFRAAERAKSGVGLKMSPGGWSSATARESQILIQPMSRAGGVVCDSREAFRRRPVDAALSILIADDEPIARQILREHIDSIPRLEIAGEASTGKERCSGSWTWTRT